MLIDKTLAEYTNLLSSDAPTPGGGSSLALVGLNATCLVMMAANVTITKLSKKGVDCPQLRESVAKLEQTKQAFCALIDQDAAAFSKILGAMKMPKATEYEIAQRKQALQEAYIYSAKVSLEIIQNAADCYKLADQVVEFADKFVVSDAHIGKALAKTVATLNVHNVDVNVDCIVCDKQKQALTDEKQALLALLD
jgi:formiminotetrahydrofolate cyclodeaminase